MICIIALVVFSILSIFSVKYRKIAAEAFDCVFRKMTLRPCQSGLDQRLKTGVVGFFSRKNVGLARFVVKHFELISWIFTILMFASMYFTAVAGYNYVVYGNCNGKDSDKVCLFDQITGPKASACLDPNVKITHNLTYVPPSVNDPTIGPSDAKVTIIEFGCFSCPNTKETEPAIKQILKDYEGRIRFIYRDFYLLNHPGAKERAIASECARVQGKFWEYHDRLFADQSKDISNADLVGYAALFGMDSEKFSACMSDNSTLIEVDKDFNDGISAGIYGTPTFFINNATVVGSKPYQYFKTIIDKELSKR